MREKFSIDLPRHFIFNALNSAIALCRSDPEKASKLIVSLAQCLNFSSVTQQRVLLDEELEFIESYLFIQSVRFIPRLSCSYKYSLSIGPKRFIQKYAAFNVIEKALQDAMAANQNAIGLEWGINNQENSQLWFSINGSNAFHVPIKLFEEE